MDDTLTTLIILLSSVLIIFLVAAIILIVKVIQLMAVVKEVSIKAKGVAGNVQSASEILKKSAGPLAIGKLMSSFADIAFKKRKR